ncbi:MAG: S9 family peptidase [Bacteroidales bacterium]|nr:S9 family peptidase [Bacteroidales bacterium]
MKKPSAKICPRELNAHGDIRIDNYYWLNERENPEVIAYLEEENLYQEAMMKDTEPLQQQLYDEIVGRIKQDDVSYPTKRNGYYYYSRYEEGKEYPIYCRRKDNMENPEQILLDGNKMAEGYHYFDIGAYSVSPDNKMLAYSVDTVSRRQYDICFKGLEDERVKGLEGEVIKNTTGNMVWANDNETIFYSVKDESLRSCKIMRHKLNTSPDDDVLVYFEEDTAFNCFVGKSKSKKYIMIMSESTLSSEVRFIDADNPYGDFKVFQKRQDDMLYGIGHYGEHFYILTNADGAKNFKIMKTSVEMTEKENWVEIMSHRDDVLIEDFDLYADYLVIEERHQGLVKIRVMTWDFTTDYYIDFGEPAYTAYSLGNPDFDTHLLRYGYNSMTTPSSLYEYDMISRESVLLKRQEIVGGYEPSCYVTERHWAASHDGVMVPISLVYKKGMKRDGSNSLVLYGYGSYGSSMDAYFSSARLSLLDRGFIWAIAHVRGGEELGRQWYEDGKMLNKRNSFLDFIYCGKYLVKEGFTCHDRMFAMGGSAGGLLVGAVANMAPEMWRGIMAQVPFVDVVTTMLDESIPLTTGEYDEWGNPNIKEYYDYMKSYSPYDNVERKDYPAMLVTTGLHDSQVQYWEPAKWVAKLREMKTDDNPLYLKTNMDFGHGGASGRFEGIKEIALEYAFLLSL